MSSNGVILERLSGRKLSVLVALIVICQAAFFLVGSLKFPNATHTETVEGIMCRDKQAYAHWQPKSGKNLPTTKADLYYLRDYLGRILSNCEHIQVDQRKNIILNANPEEIVYAFQIPLPRDNMVLRLHRFFQSMTSILHLQVVMPQSDKEIFEEHKLSHEIPLNVRLAYRSRNDPDNDWHEMAQSKINKQFDCVKGQYSLDCDMVQLFELGSVHHEFYLINIKLGESKLVKSIKSADSGLYHEQDLPEVRLMLTFIYQTGGFTQMWLIMKSCAFPVVLFIMCWYWNRISQLDRQSNLLEQMLLALGISLTLLNLPVEWLTLWFDLKWMLLYTDLRQGIFYTTLFTFWIVFCGEHYVDDNETSKACTSLKSYWKYICALWLGSVCLLTFELCQRGMQLADPFFSIWDSKSGTNIAMVMLIIACASGLFYFALLAYLVGKVFYNFYSKQSNLPTMNRMRRAFYEAVIYRFKFLLASTLFCAALTISFFIVNNVNDSAWHFSDENVSLNYTAGFFTGVYGMWNLYVTSVMIFYAPSHKNKLVAQHYDNKETEEISMQSRLIQSEVLSSTTESVVTAFANKIASS